MAAKHKQSAGSDAVRPFLKWAGNKFRIIDKVKKKRSKKKKGNAEKQKQKIEKQREEAGTSKKIMSTREAFADL